MAKKCSIPECQEILSEHAISPVCINCRSSIGRWKRRRPAERLERSRKLRVWGARLEELADANVVVLHKKRRAS